MATESNQGRETDPAEPTAEVKLRHFLKEAPNGLAPWAQARLEDLEAGRDEYLHLLEVTESETVAPDIAVALTELGEDGEDPRIQISTPSTRGRTTLTNSASPPLSGNQNPPAAATVEVRQRRWIIALVAVLAVCLVGGSYFLGRYQGGMTSGLDGAGNESSSSADSARVKELQASLESDPNQPTAHLELGLLLFNRGDTKGALTHWQETVKQDPNNIEGWYNLGFYYLSQDPPDNDAAKKAWEKVLELDPDSPLAQTVQSHLGALLPAEGSTRGGDTSESPSQLPTQDGK